MSVPGGVVCGKIVENDSCGAHKSVAVLQNDVRDRIKVWNENPKPFRWNKTVEEILDSFAKHMARISGAGL
jgi:hypothetical protein